MTVHTGLLAKNCTPNTLMPIQNIIWMHVSGISIKILLLIATTLCIMTQFIVYNF